MTTEVAFDQAKAETFIGKALGDVSGQMAVVLAHIGDRLGLFKDLTTNGPATDAELAKRAGINQRYAREWLGGMATAGYLEYDPSSDTFILPPEHVAVLATEGSPVFLGGFYQALPSFLKPIDQLLEAFRKGGGVPPSAYDSGLWESMERHGAHVPEQLLLQQWLPAMPDVDAKLKAGGSLADVGCGSGRALIKLAEAYPLARFVGFDISDSQLERARGNIAAAGLGDRVSVEKRDVGQGLPEQYDVITTFDVIHDAVDPLGLLAAIRKGLKADGIYVCADINSSSRLEENIGPLGTVLHGVSVLYCMTTSLAGGGAGLGTLGFHEPKAREMCAEVGFGSVRKLPMENAFNNVYEIRA